MSRRILLGTTLLWCYAAVGQTPPADQSTPVYRVTVIGRTIKAVNYGERNVPTKIDFRGTVLAPNAKGKATVESKRGATRIDAKLEHLPPPAHFGAQYLTYVLWAITPEGRADNLGEIVLDPSNDGKLKVTTDLQAFGLLITAEPYYSVTRPSDVVVLENAVRSDTIGTTQDVAVKPELLPRGEYTMSVGPRANVQEGKKVPYHEYEALVALYQARNAVQIAQAEKADRYAPESFQKAQRLLQQADQYHAQKLDSKQVIQVAREAAQAAEDARAITHKRAEQDRITNEQAHAAERTARVEADAQAAINQARQEADEARRQAAVGTAPAQQQPLAGPTPQDLRLRLAQQLSASLDTRDTPRGLVVTLFDDLFEPSSDALRPAGRERLSRIADAINTQPGLKVEVEGYSQVYGAEPQLMSRRAAAVRDYLLAKGVQAASITARGLSMRPPAGSSSARHVEIVVSGEPISAISVSRLAPGVSVQGDAR